MGITRNKGKIKMENSKTLKSVSSFCDLENADIRNVLKGMGYSDDDLTSRRPVIGIANSWSTLIPGHFNFPLFLIIPIKGDLLTI